MLSSICRFRAKRKCSICRSPTRFRSLNVRLTVTNHPKYANVTSISQVPRWVTKRLNHKQPFANNLSHGCQIRMVSKFACRHFAHQAEPTRNIHRERGTYPSSLCQPHPVLGQHDNACLLRRETLGPPRFSALFVSGTFPVRLLPILYSPKISAI